MKKLGALLLMTAMTLFAFIAVAAPAFAWNPVITQDCSGFHVSQPPEEFTYTYTATLDGTSVASGTVPGDSTFDVPATNGQTLVVTNSGNNQQAGDSQVFQQEACETVPPTTTTTVPPVTTTTTVPPHVTTTPPTTTTVPPTTTTHTTHTSVPPTHVTKPPKVTKSPPSELAFTGVENIVPIAVGALVLLVAGSAMLWVARRRTDA